MVVCLCCRLWLPFVDGQVASKPQGRPHFDLRFVTKYYSFSLPFPSRRHFTFPVRRASCSSATCFVLGRRNTNQNFPNYPAMRHSRRIRCTKHVNGYARTRIALKINDFSQALCLCALNNSAPQGKIRKEVERQRRLDDGDNTCQQRHRHRASKRRQRGRREHAQHKNNNNVVGGR